LLKKGRMKSYIVLLLAMLLILAPVISASSAVAGNVAKMQDNELVLSTLDDSGSISGIQVLSHMRVVGNGDVTIQDPSKFKLSSVRNLYGTEKISQKDGQINYTLKLNQATGFSDIYYLSALDKAEIAKASMPVSVKVTYYLDGQQIKPSKLAGKSGHLKIVCDLENLTGAKKVLEFKNKQGETVKSESMVYTPFVVAMSGWEFDNKKFSNIQAPGIAGVSPQGVVLDVQGKTQVSWTVPMIPPSYPAKQYTVLEADGKNIEMPSYKIAVIPIVPTTSAIDNLGTFQASFGQLYDAFDQIQNGVGATSKDATLMFGLNAVKGGLGQVSGGIGSVLENLKTVRLGVSNPKFETASYDATKGTDAKGNKPGVREAVTMSKTAMDNQLMPAFEGQKTVLTVMEATMGKPGAEPVTPSLTTSLYNDVDFLKTMVAGTPAEAVLTQALGPKIAAMGTDLGVLRDGGTLITATGAVPFPASVNAVSTGVQQISTGLGKANNGLSMIAFGLGQLDAKGNPTPVMIDGKPGSLLYALSYLQSAVDGQLVPGINQLSGGTAKIGAGSGQAKTAIAGGLQTLESVPAIVSALQDNASQANTFLGKPAGAQGSVTYVYQTAAVIPGAAAMNYGFGVIILALILLFAIGRPKSAPQVAEMNKEM
jgi:X-X-X-Leu-X-X-Gly heptad repeat protein